MEEKIFTAKELIRHYNVKADECFKGFPPDEAFLFSMEVTFYPPILVRLLSAHSHKICIFKCF